MDVVLERIHLSSHRIGNNGLVHIGQYTLDARNMLGQDALDTLGQGKRGKRAVDTGPAQRNIDDALFIIDFRHVNVSAIGLNLRKRIPGLKA